MTDFTNLAERYIAVWNETDPAARRTRVRDVWAADGTYVDPMTDAAGIEQIDASIAAVQQQFTGLTFRLLGEVDAHHDQARFRWGLGPAGEEPLAVGFDVVVADDEGRARQVLGFLDRVPS